MAARSQKNAEKFWFPRVKVMMKCWFKSSALLRKYLRRKPATLLRPSKKSKVDQLSSITIRYMATINGSKDPIL
jgi:hypothetical protein